MADLERVLVPLYLAHRYQVEAVSKVIGGVRYTYAVRGDGQLTNEPVTEAEQQRAFNILLATLQPDFLALPENIIRLIPPQPIGFSRDRELFKSNTGGLFDPLAAAGSSADLTLRMLLMPERLNRLSEQEARGVLRTFTLNAILGQLNTALSVKNAGETPMQAAIRRDLQQLLLNRLLTLAVSDAATPTVKGTVLMEINEMEKTGAQQLLRETDVHEKANLTWMLEQIRQFRLKPGDFKPAPAMDTPPGQPIGCDGE